MLQSLLTLAYPAIVYLALPVMEPRWVALAALALLALRLGFQASSGAVRTLAGALALPAASVGTALLFSAVWNDPLGLRLTPALVSFALLFSFGMSLRGESIVERLARVQHGNLDEQDTRYCRSVTLLWCCFFIVNGVIVSALAVGASNATWAVYSGLVAYLLIGALFASEYTYRQWRFRRYFGAPTDVLFRRLFPPRS